MLNPIIDKPKWLSALDNGALDIVHGLSIILATCLLSDAQPSRVARSIVLSPRQGLGYSDLRPTTFWQEINLQICKCMNRALARFLFTLWRGHIIIS